MRKNPMRAIALAVAVIFSTTAMTGCGTMTGIPSHGGGKRFAVEQRLVSASIRGTLMDIDVSPLRGKKVAVIFDLIADEGGGSLNGGRLNILAGITSGYVSSPVTSSNSQFQIFNLAESGTNFQNQNSTSAANSTSTGSSSTNSTGTSTQTSNSSGSSTTNGSSTSSGTSTDTSTSGSTTNSNGSSNGSGSTSTTTGSVITNQNDSSSSSNTGSSTTNNSGTSSGTTTGNGTNNSTTVSSGSQTTNGSSTDKSTGTTTGNQNTTGTGTQNGTGGYSNTKQAISPTPSATQSQTKGNEKRSNLTMNYQGMGEYQNFNVPKSDASLLTGLVRNYLLLNGVLPTTPDDPTASVILYVTVDIFGTTRSRFDIYIFNQENLKAETSIEMMAFDRSGKMIMAPKNANREAKYDENYFLWAGPFKTDETLRQGKGLLVNFENVDGTKPSYPADVVRWRWEGNAR